MLIRRGGGILKMNMNVDMQIINKAAQKVITFDSQPNVNKVMNEAGRDIKLSQPIANEYAAKILDRLA
ncbi:MAG: hypothetical protein PHV68_00515 [Candidatus Gastranaerophilales bacterium]|nr:hypothetical protein [Candidatus Gastranaerophilales bacterium]